MTSRVPMTICRCGHSADAHDKTGGWIETGCRMRDEDDVRCDCRRYEEG